MSRWTNKSSPQDAGAIAIAGALLGLLVVAGCNPEFRPHAAAGGTAGVIGSLDDDDWTFGGRSMQPGYLYDWTDFAPAWHGGMGLPVDQGPAAVAGLAGPWR